MPPLGMAASLHKMEVGARLRLAIASLGRTPADVSRILGVTQQKLGNWMRGDNYPDETFIVSFCDRFNVSMDWIYRGRVSVVMDGPLVDALWAGAKASPPDQADEAPREPETRKRRRVRAS